MHARSLARVTTGLNVAARAFSGVYFDQLEWYGNRRGYDLTRSALRIQLDIPDDSPAAILARGSGLVVFSVPRPDTLGGDNVTATQRLREARNFRPAVNKSHLTLRQGCDLCGA